MTAIRILSLLVLGAAIAKMAKSAPDKKLDVPQALVAEAEAVVRNARPLLSRMWDEMGRTMGVFEPRLRSYRETIEHTGCGPVEPGNARYCMTDNTIYYDPAFLATIMREVGGSSGTDGSYAVVAAMEHELGHALAWRRVPVQSVLSSMRGNLDSYVRESYADCAAGAMSARARQLGMVGANRIGEAERMLDLVSDRELLIEGAHGDRTARLAAFRQGYRQGSGSISACTIESFERRFRLDSGDSGDTTMSCSDYGNKYGLQAQLRASALGICK